MARVKINELPQRERGLDNETPVFDETAEYLNLLANAVTIEGLSAKSARVAINELISAGHVGYDAITGKFYEVAPVGKDDEGDPIKGLFTTKNGRSFERKFSYEPKEDGAFYFRALPYGEITFKKIIERSTSFMSICDRGARQNAKACMTPYIVTCKDDNTLLSLRHAIGQKQDGQVALIVSEGLADSLTATNVGVDFLASQFKELGDKERDTLLKKLGIATDITKGERVQTSEVNANVCQASDYLYMLIDTFNRQAKDYGLPFEMVANITLEELFTEAQNQEEPKQEETMHD